MNQLVDAFLEKVAATFWNSAGMQSHDSRNLAQAAAVTLPLDVVTLNNLCMRRVEQWLRERGVQYKLDVPDCLLYGLLVVYRGSGLIFLEGGDDKRTRRFTLAHEIAHFLLDYERPRNHAVQRLGTNVLDIFDGRRSATHDEQIIGAMTDVEMKPHVHLLTRSEDTSAWLEDRGKTENRADRLALELLAPVYEVFAILHEQGSTEHYSRCLSIADTVLKEVYELPEPIADSYARRLVRAITGGPSMFMSIITT